MARIKKAHEVASVDGASSEALSPDAALVARIAELEKQNASQKATLSALEDGEWLPPDNNDEEYIIVKRVETDKRTKVAVHVPYKFGVCAICGRDIGEEFKVRTDSPQEDKDKLKRTLMKHRRLEHPGQFPNVVKKSMIPTSNMGDGKTRAEMGLPDQLGVMQQEAARRNISLDKLFELARITKPMQDKLFAASGVDRVS
jgi:hypothetical protein